VRPKKPATTSPSSASTLKTSTVSESQLRHPLSQRFHDILLEMGEMHDRKQADYGKADNPFANVSDGALEVGLEPWIGAVIRMGDKMRRLQAAARGQNLVNESICDSFIDLAVYSAIGLVLYEEAQK
jgi:hypothetical protein